MRCYRYAIAVNGPLSFTIQESRRAKRRRTGRMWLEESFEAHFGDFQNGPKTTCFANEMPEASMGQTITRTQHGRRYTRQGVILMISAIIQLQGG